MDTSDPKTLIINALVVVAIVLIGALGYAASVSRTTPAPTGSVYNGTISSIRIIPSATQMENQLVVEIEVTSDKEFPVRNELAALHIGAQEFTMSRYPESGDTHTLIFTLTTEGFAKIATGDLVTVYYGRGGEPGEQWNFGPLDKGLLDKKNSIPIIRLSNQHEQKNISDYHIHYRYPSPCRHTGVLFFRYSNGA